MRVLSRSDVRSLAPMARAIDLMGLAFGDLADGTAVSPLRTAIDVPAGPGTTLVMPAYVPSVAALGVKVVSVFPENRQRDLPSIASVVCLVDDSTGRPLAMMDGGYLTALRTGAISGLATRLLSRPESRVLTVVGAGAQAVTQAAAVCEVRDIDRVIFVVRSDKRIDSLRVALREEWPSLMDRVEFAMDVPTAVREADIICAATSSSTPVFDDEDIRPGVHINGVGSFKPEMQEIPAETVRRAIVVVDQLEPALEEAGDLIVPLRDGVISRAHLSREIGQLVKGSASGRQGAEDVTFFKSVGNAVQDMVVARDAFDQAEKRDEGQVVSLS